MRCLRCCCPCADAAGRAALATVAGVAAGGDYDVVVVGAGFAGLYQLRRLRELGLSVVLVEAGSGLGGIWHWNCYPGARVDSHVPVYEYSDERVWRDWYWDERFPDWAALRRYFDHVDDCWDVRRDVRFNSRVEAAVWDDGARTWSASLSDGDVIRARYLVLCTGFAAKPYIPDLPGLADFTGESHHTARWPQDGIDMTGLRVGVLGTGASGVQVIQEAAQVASEVTVFQRTPMMALPMRQRSLTRAQQDTEKATYPAVFRKRSETNSGFDYPGISERTLDVPVAERIATYEKLWDTGGFAFWAGNYTDILLDESANHLAYEFWRDKVRARVDDAQTAALLAPTDPPHPFGVKRPSLEQNYYDVFNQDNVALVDLRSTPVERATPTGVRTSARDVDLDVLVLATGFDAVTGGLTSIDARGVNGESFGEHWRDGVRTHLGVASNGFPNLLYLYGPQSPAGFCNGPTCAELQGDWIVDLLVHLHEAGATRIEATAEAESSWREQVLTLSSTTLFPRADSWYMGANIPGKPREMLNWPGGLQLYLSACRASAEMGYAGFTIS
jgi:cation diffusion facilitator CzcD-associated flavoprotein CzcO